MEHYACNEDSLIAVAQHYRIPTNFVDFSSCPVVASFFATDGAVEGDKGCIILVNQAEFERFIKTVSAFQPSLKEIEFLTLETPNLWRLEAQKGLFLNFPVVDFEKNMYPFDRITFNSDGKQRFDQTEFYPKRKSDLERLLDHFFMEEGLISGAKNLRKLIPNASFINFGPDRSVLYEHNVISNIELHPSWSKTHIEDWVEVSSIPENFQKLKKDDFILPYIELDNALDFSNSITDYFLHKIEAGKLVRSELYSFKLEPKLEISGDKIIAGVERIWDGMRRLPYSNTEISTSLARFMTYCIFPATFSKQVLGDSIKVEFCGKGGSYSRALVSDNWYSFGIRADFFDYVDKEYKSKLHEMHMRLFRPKNMSALTKWPVFIRHIR